MDDEKLINLYEEIESTLFLDSKLIEIIEEVIEEVIEYDDFNFDNFKLYFESKIDSDYDDKLKWLILKNYTTIENLNKIDFEAIENDFYNDIKKCFEVIGE